MQRLKNLQRLPTNKGDTMILETIADANRVRYEEIEKQVPLEVIKQKALSMETDNEFPFEKALAGKDISFICEVKKASPSKGIIAEDFPYVQIAKDYENAGASAISVLTEPKWFKGENAFLEEISKNVSIPLLRKDFTVLNIRFMRQRQSVRQPYCLSARFLTRIQSEDGLSFATLSDFRHLLRLTQPMRCIPQLPQEQELSV